MLLQEIQEIQPNQFYTTYEETKNWLDQMGVTSYTINPNTLTVDVNGNVDIRKKSLKTIPVKFYRVVGDFECGFNKLTTLIGSPNFVDKGFLCHMNELVTLQGGPQYVGAEFWCNENNLISLEGAPEYVGGEFSCYKNKLKSLQGTPKYIGARFNCGQNLLTSLEGCLPHINEELICDGNNNIISTINKYVKSVPHISLTQIPPNMTKFMPLFFIKKLKKVDIYGNTTEQEHVCKIINKHLNGDRSGPACQLELIDAGLSKYIKI